MRGSGCMAGKWPALMGVAEVSGLPRTPPAVDPPNRDSGGDPYAPTLSTRSAARRSERIPPVHCAAKILYVIFWRGVTRMHEFGPQDRRRRPPETMLGPCFPVRYAPLAVLG
jgi:hypothetical protein